MSGNLENHALELPLYCYDSGKMEVVKFQKCALVSHTLQLRRPLRVDDLMAPHFDVILFGI